MSAKIIDGKQISAYVYEEIKKDIVLLREKHDIVPGLAVVLAGENPASAVYVRKKKETCERLGIYSEEYRFMSSAREVEIMELLDRLNNNPAIHGILVQLPLPEGINTAEIQNTVSVYKDVDGFSADNMGRLLMGQPRFIPCTPLGVLELLSRSGIETDGRHAVIVGRSNIVGKPMAALLMLKQKNANATVTVCHSGSRDLGEITKTADILIAAAGRPRFIKGDMIKDGAVVIDVGINKDGNNLIGDVDFDDVSQKAGYITKVPGGVGPMTIAMLMRNTVIAAKLTVRQR